MVRGGGATGAPLAVQVWSPPPRHSSSRGTLLWSIAERCTCLGQRSGGDEDRADHWLVVTFSPGLWGCLRRVFFSWNFSVFLLRLISPFGVLASSSWFSPPSTRCVKRKESRETSRLRLGRVLYYQLLYKLKGLSVAWFFFSRDLNTKVLAGRVVSFLRADRVLICLTKDRARQSGRKGGSLRSSTNYALYPHSRGSWRTNQHAAFDHKSRETIGLLREKFPGRVISRNGDYNWPPRSCDLTPLDCKRSRVGHMNDIVFHY